MYRQENRFTCARPHIMTELPFWLFSLLACSPSRKSWKFVRGVCVFTNPRHVSRASQVALVVKNLPANAGDMRHGFYSWLRKIPWRRAWQPTAACLPGESHGQRSLAGYSPWGHRIGHDWSNLAQHITSLKQTSEWLVLRTSRAENSRFSEFGAPALYLSNCIDSCSTERLAIESSPQRCNFHIPFKS